MPLVIAAKVVAQLWHSGDLQLKIVIQLEENLT
jgi:hypothetical protein